MKARAIRKIKIEHDPYKNPVPASSLERLSKEECAELSDKQIGDKFEFTSEYLFETGHLNYILERHTQCGANAYYIRQKGKVLFMKFYKK